MSLKAQVVDSFADGNFDKNPTWKGDSSHFTVTASKELRLKAPSLNASSSLAVTSQAIGGAEWKASIKLDFNPSGANYLDFHIISSSNVLDSAHQGYFVRVGDSEDELALYRQDGSSATELIDGPNGLTDKDPVVLRVKVERSGTGHFTLSVDSNGTGFKPLDSIYDDSVQISAYSGFECQYTATRSDKFYFEKLEVNGSPYQDSIPPKLDSITVPKKGQLLLRFDETLDTGGLNANAFKLKPVGGTPASISFSSSRDSLWLHYTEQLPNDTILELQTPQLTDTLGNSLPPMQRMFHYLVIPDPLPGGILINEIMADPTPSVGLPDLEYLELHAPSDKIQATDGWQLIIDGDSASLPQRVMRPGDRFLLIPASDSSFFDPPDPPLLIDQLPSLVNSGEQLVLRAPDGTTIDSVSYKEDWYGSNEKDDGGWSLERIAPSASCALGANWKASQDPKGGTPGRPNSVLDPGFDQKAPSLKSSYTLNDSSVLLRFDEKAFPDSNWSKALTLPNALTLDTVRHGTEKAAIKLILSNPLDSGIWYELEVGPIKDCFGNRRSEPTKERFILPYTPRPKDVVINEVLFDPPPEGVDFVELYNRSDRFIDLADLILKDPDAPHGSNSTLQGKERILSPGEYRYITEAPGTIADLYPHTPEEKGYRTNSLPAYPNDSGIVLLKEKGGATIDSFAYKASIHHPLLDDPEGVSLERIDPNGWSQKKDNWHSASSSVSYATPGEENSQYLEEKRGSKAEHLWSTPDVFTPNMDGDRDLLRIHYRFSKPGMSCSLMILTPRGRTVKRLLDGEILERRGWLTWNGTRTDGKKVPIGIYVIFLECIHPDGDRIREKKSCVVGKPLGGR